MNKMSILIKKSVAGFRDMADLSQSEPIKTHSLLLKLNIVAVFRPLSENFSGAAIKSGDSKFILINSSHSLGRQNFTIVHELYHLYVEEDFIPHRCLTGAFNRVSETEYLADSFSANLLMPESGILDIIPGKELGLNKITNGTLLKIGQFFGVSHLALLFRLKELGLINKAFIEQNKNDITDIARRYGFDISLYLPANHGLVIGDYGILANNLLQSGKISESHFSELMNSLYSE
ncbi:MAG TPA: ImmA/IrrE family metallo-endopeptidase [Bacteroidales bacterium]|nr:ImmA/IrrE family metallo-endopeptidase [Bacteroidales bacterium]